MQAFSSETARMSPEEGLDIGRWTQYGIDDELPFGAMWYVVPPGSSSEVDRHPERELAVVVAGSARFAAPGATDGLVAATGTAVLLESDEPHVVHNRSDTEPVVVLSVYWMPDTAGTAGGE